ncbi:MAG: hypothetical protein QOI06_151 [Nocardioidaceae bacterium]|jgi:uncharacterized protein (TIGR03118 family)|nr:hypothetical protein [Nocardioidaceae bacterium]
MQSGRWRWSLGVAAVGALALASIAPAQAGTHPSAATTYDQVNLVSDVAGNAQITDPNLVNPWGLSFSPTSPMWVSDNGTNVSTLYQGGIHGGTESIVPLVVTIPGGAPTGQAFNGTSDFVVHDSKGNSGPAAFIFDGESGHISGWNPGVGGGTHAQNAVVTHGAVYKGLSLGSEANEPRLYAADFSGRTVDVFNGHFDRVITRGNFEDPELPANFAPFNVAVLGDMVYVSYAERDKQHTDEVDGAGLGRVDVFTQTGNLVTRMPDHSALNAPWGLAIAPTGFGSFAGDLLVGNFGNGRIHAYNPQNLSFVGTLRDSHHNPISIDGLWALLPGNGVQSGTDQVVFSAGPNDEQHGLIGTLSVTS